MMADCMAPHYCILESSRFNASLGSRSDIYTQSVCNKSYHDLHTLFPSLSLSSSILLAEIFFFDSMGTFSDWLKYRLTTPRSNHHFYQQTFSVTVTRLSNKSITTQLTSYHAFSIRSTIHSSYSDSSLLHPSRQHGLKRKRIKTNKNKKVKIGCPNAKPFTPRRQLAC